MAGVALLEFTELQPTIKIENNMITANFPIRATPGFIFATPHYV
jgi:hypothetical protein